MFWAWNISTSVRINLTICICNVDGLQSWRGSAWSFVIPTWLTHFYFWGSAITTGRQRGPRVFSLSSKGDQCSDLNPTKYCHNTGDKYKTGEILSKDFDCNFGEVAAADQVVEVRRGFNHFLLWHHLTSLVVRFLRSDLENWLKGISTFTQVAEAFHDLCRDVNQVLFTIWDCQSLFYTSDHSEIDVAKYDNWCCPARICWS